MPLSALRSSNIYDGPQLLRLSPGFSVILLEATVRWKGYKYD